VRKIQGAILDGKSIRETARELGLARNTVRKYMRGERCGATRAPRGSQLDAFKDQIRRWVKEDHLFNVEVMFPRLRARGYAGGKTVIKDFVQPLRPARAGHRPVIRYETPPGRQMQMDWGEFTFEQDGRIRKVYGFTLILSYSRMRYVEFVSRCDERTLLRCLEHGCAYFSGQPERILTDRMKTVFLRMDGQERVWNPLFEQAMSTLGMVPAVCKAYTPQTKGKVERTVDVIKQSFWPGVSFTDLDDLNAQARAWCEEINGRVHMTTRRIPREMWREESLKSLASHAVWAPFVREERKVSWDGFFSFDGVLYGLPAAAAMAGAQVTIDARGTHLDAWSGDEHIAQLTRQTSGIVVHPDQWTGLTPAAALRRREKPLGHQVSAPVVEKRPLAAYEALAGLAVGA
jgi:transposase